MPTFLSYLQEIEWKTPYIVQAIEICARSSNNSRDIGNIWASVLETSQEFFIIRLDGLISRQIQRESASERGWRRDGILPAEGRLKGYIS